jgi:hypothetical protein
MTIEEQIENLRQNLMELTARVGANETFTRAAFVIMCSYSADPEGLDKLKNGIFPMLLEQTRTRKYEGTPPELARWLVAKELAILQAEFEEILKGAEAIRRMEKRTLN